MKLMGKQYLIDEDLANAILEYLAQQPYKEVYKFVPLLQHLDEAPTVPDQNALETV